MNSQEPVTADWLRRLNSHRDEVAERALANLPPGDRISLTRAEAALAADALSLAASQRVSGRPTTDEERAAWALEDRLRAFEAEEDAS